MSVTPVTIGIADCLLEPDEPGAVSLEGDLAELFPRGVRPVPACAAPHPNATGEGGGLAGWIRPEKACSPCPADSVPQRHDPVSGASFAIPAITTEGLKFPETRAAFRDRAQAIHRWQATVVAHPGPEGLHTFHQRSALALMGRDPGEFAALSRIVDQLGRGEIDFSTAAAAHLSRTLNLLARPVTPRGLGAVLGTVWDQLAEEMTPREQRELGQQIWAFLRGRTPARHAVHRARELLTRYPHTELAEQLEDQAQSLILAA